jgi:hypothetical protein
MGHPVGDDTEPETDPKCPPTEVLSDAVLNRDGQDKQAQEVEEGHRVHRSNSRRGSLTSNSPRNPHKIPATAQRTKNRSQSWAS